MLGRAARRDTGAVGSDGEVEEVSPLWLSHHWPDDYDRCVVVGGRHVCRRCLVLYPLALAVALVTVAVGGGFGPLGTAGLVLLPLAAVVELWAEGLGTLRNRVGRVADA